MPNNNNESKIKRIGRTIGNIIEYAKLVFWIFAIVMIIISAIISLLPSTRAARKIKAELTDSYRALCADSFSSEPTNDKASGLLYVESYQSTFQSYFSGIEGLTTAIGVGEPQNLLCIQMAINESSRKCRYSVIGIVPVQRRDVTFTVVGIEGKDTLVKKEFPGPVRDCPDSVEMGTKVIPAEVDLHDFVLEEAVLAWLHENWSP